MTDAPDRLPRNNSGAGPSPRSPALRGDSGWCLVEGDCLAKRETVRGRDHVAMQPSSYCLNSIEPAFPHQLSCNNEIAWRGNLKFNSTPPCLTSTHCGDSNSCNCPAASSAVYCSGLGVCGEPKFFH